MKSKIIGSIFCILVLGASIWLVKKAPTPPVNEPEITEEETYVPPQKTIETDVTRAYVIETAHNAEDLFERLAYESDANYKNTIQNLSERLTKSAAYLKDELQDFHGAAYFTKLSEIFQDLIDNPFTDSKTFSERAKKVLTELKNAYPAEAAKEIDENDPKTPMYYPQFDVEVNGKTTLALLALYRMQYLESNNSILLTFGGNLVPGDTLLDTDKNDSFKSISTESKLPYPLYSLSSVLSTDTASFANLATPLTNSVGDSFSAGSTKGLPSYAKLLKDGGIDAVSIANNDVLSFGDAGKTDTINALNEANLPFSEDGTITYIETKLGKIAYLSYNIIYKTTSNKEEAYTEAPKKDIAAAKEAGAKFIITHFNWVNAGTNSWDPSTAQIQTARIAVENGSNLVFGSHPNAIQSIEQYRGVSIVYCSGDLFRMNAENTNAFIFQQAFTLDENQKAVPGDIFILPLGDSKNNKNLPIITFDSESVETFKNIITTSSANVVYGVGLNDTFTTEHLNLISIEK